jgi:hypothetical protein
MWTALQKEGSRQRPEQPKFLKMASNTRKAGNANINSAQPALSPQQRK